MGMGKRFADASMAKISSMESRLSGALKPVRPRQEFVHGLSQRIQTGNRTSLVNHVANWHFLALIIAGFLSLAVLVAMVTRAVLMALGKKRTA
jgi:hypothetical protein